MAQIIRMIWRLDYSVSYAYLDKRGAALQALGSTVEGFWENLGDGTVHMSYIGSTTKEGVHRNISVEPNSLNGDIQWPGGKALDRVLRDDSFRGVDQIVRSLCKVCEIKSVARVGMRLLCVSKYADGRRGRERALAQVGDEVKLTTTTSLGPIEDFSFTFEGKTGDNVGYRAIFGPYDEKNVLNSLQNKPKKDELRLLSEADLFFDIDLFEVNLSFTEHSLFRWSETKVAKALDFIAKCSGEKVSEVNDGGRRKGS